MGRAMAARTSGGQGVGPGMRSCVMRVSLGYFINFLSLEGALY